MVRKKSPDHTIRRCKRVNNRRNVVHFVQYPLRKRKCHISDSYAKNWFSYYKQTKGKEKIPMGIRERVRPLFLKGKYSLLRKLLIAPPAFIEVGSAAADILHSASSALNVTSRLTVFAIILQHFFSISLAFSFQRRNFGNSFLCAERRRSLETSEPVLE